MNSCSFSVESSGGVRGARLWTIWMWHWPRGRFTKFKELREKPHIFQSKRLSFHLYLYCLYLYLYGIYIYICVWNAIMYAFACFTLLHSIEIKDGKNIDIFRMSTIYSIPSFAAWWLNSCIMLHPLRVSMTTWGMWPGFATSWARRSPCEAAEGWDLPTRASQCPIRGPNFPGLGPQAGDVARWTPGGLRVDHFKDVFRC